MSAPGGHSDQHKKILTKIINSKRKTDLLGLLQAQREGKLEEYLRPDLEKAGLITPAQKNEEPSQHNVNLITPASLGDVSREMQSQPEMETSGLPPEPLADSKQDTLSTNQMIQQCYEHEAGTAEQLPSEPSNDHKVDNVVLPSHLTSETPEANVGSKKVHFDEESIFQFLKPTISVEDAKTVVTRGSVMAKAAVFSLGRRPADQEEFQAREYAVTSVRNGSEIVLVKNGLASVPSSTAVRRGSSHSLTVNPGDTSRTVGKRTSICEPNLETSGNPSNATTERSDDQNSSSSDTKTAPAVSASSSPVVSRKPFAPSTANQTSTKQSSVKPSNVEFSADDARKRVMKGFVASRAAKFDPTETAVEAEKDETPTTAFTTMTATDAKLLVGRGSVRDRAAMFASGKVQSRDDESSAKSAENPAATEPSASPDVMPRDASRDTVNTHEAEQTSPQKETVSLPETISNVDSFRSTEPIHSNRIQVNVEAAALADKDTQSNISKPLQSNLAQSDSKKLASAAKLFNRDPELRISIGKTETKITNPSPPFQGSEVPAIGINSRADTLPLTSTNSKLRVPDDTEKSLVDSVLQSDEPTNLDDDTPPSVMKSEPELTDAAQVKSKVLLVNTLPRSSLATDSALSPLVEDYSPEVQASKRSDTSNSLDRRRSVDTSEGKLEHTQSKQRFGKLRAALEGSGASEELLTSTPDGMKRTFELTQSKMNGTSKPQTVTSSRIAVDVKHIATRRDAMNKSAIISTTIPSCVQIDSSQHDKEDTVIPSPQDWAPKYVVVSNNALFMGEYVSDTSRQVSGKFQRIMKLKDATIRFIEHNSSPSGFVLCVKEGGGCKRMYLNPQSIKTLLEFGAVVQQAIDKVSQVTPMPYDSVSSSVLPNDKTPTGFVDPSRWAADYRKRRAIASPTL